MNQASVYIENMKNRLNTKIKGKGPSMKDVANLIKSNKYLRD